MTLATIGRTTNALLRDHLDNAMRPAVGDVVEIDPTAHQAAESNTYHFNDHMQTTLYVTRVHRAYSPHYDYLIGTYRKVFPSPSGEGWFCSLDGGGIIRVYGGIVCPETENAKHYRILSGDRQLVQYFDSPNDRNHAASPFNIIAGENGPWHAPNDAIFRPADPETMPYLEVKAPEGVSDVRQSEEAVAEQQISETARATKGLAATNYDGTIDENPEMVKGVTYVGWGVESYPNRLFLFTTNSDSEEYIHVVTQIRELANGELNASRADVVWIKTDMKHWAKVKTERPDPVVNEDTTANLRRLISIEVGKYESLNTEMNEVAANEDWCSEYEDTIIPLGMERRTAEKTDWDVDVSVAFTMVESNPSQSFDETLRDLWDDQSHGLSTSYVRIEGRATISVMVEATDREDAYEQVDHDAVQSKLDDIFPGTIEFDEWECVGAEEV